MPDISVQFHATPDELMNLILEMVGDFKIKAQAMRYDPFEIKAVPYENLISFFENSPTHRRWSFTLNEPILSVRDELTFADWNPDHLRLDVGNKTRTYLKQSWLVARTSNVNALAVWKKVARRIKEMTKQGVTAVNPKTGATCRIKSFRFSKGAKLLEVQGIQMLPFSGTSRLIFD